MTDRSIAEVMHEAEVRGRVEGEMAEEMEQAGERDKAIRAVTIFTVVAVVVLVPLLALVLGVAVRIFGAVSGLY